jgi:Ca2+-transporting ATPase
MSVSKKYLSDCLTNNSKQVLEGAGKNIIPEAEKQSLWLKFFEKFKDPIIVILLVVLAFSVMVSLYEIFRLGKPLTTLIEPAGIFIAIILATGIGFIFEVRAEKEFDVLNKVKDDRPVKVIRKTGKGNRTQFYEIRRCDVCVGDIVQLESGDEVPADAVILDAASTKVDESIFTGEPYTDKYVVIPEDKKDSTFPANMLLRGTTIIEGMCVCKVTAVGPDTEEGKGARLMQEEPEAETPLSQQLGQLGTIITKASYIIACLIVLGRLLYFFFFDGDSSNNTDLIQILEFLLSSIMLAVTLIVVAVPEGLPMSVTISLALSMKKMLKEKNLVRKLHACETMGATTVICTDKTGTLTENKMKVLSSEFFVDDSLLAKSIAVNSTAGLSEDEAGNVKAVGNPTEGALLLWLKEEKGLNYLPVRDDAVILNRRVFSSSTKSMETTMADPDNEGFAIRLVKGAPEVILAQCTATPEGKSQEAVIQTLTDWQSKAMRTLAFAVQSIDPTGKKGDIFLAGIVGIADPARADVKEAIDICQGQAGVRVIMVTGDVSTTANEIGRELGIIAEGEKGQTLTGSEFAKMADEQAIQLIPRLKILSRARPEDKARLVTLLQRMGEVVAVTGDGTNDAPALKKAQVGLSMGDGTARAKEASDITIIDNSFSSINKGILWGRSIYLNIKRFILFQMTINVCACFIVLLGSFIGMESPLTVTQMLWVNLIMDTFAAMALSSLPADPRVMNDKPRDQKSHIIDKKMGRQILWVGGLFFVFLALFWQVLWHLDITSMSDLLTRESLRAFVTHIFSGHHEGETMTGYEKGIFFTVFVMLQFWNLFNARFFRTGRSLLGDFYTLLTKPQLGRKSIGQGFVIITLVILLGQFCIVNFLGPAFEVEALTMSDWGLIILVTSPIFVFPDVIRTIQKGIGHKPDSLLY